MKRALITLMVVALSFSAAVTAEAQEKKGVPAAEAEGMDVPEILQPGQRAFWGAMYLGPAIGANASFTQFKLIQTFGWHFFGESYGPAIAVELQESFGGGGVAIEVLPKFVWDFQIIKNLGLYLSPGVGVGVAHITAGYLGGGFTAATIQFTFDGKLTLLASSDSAVAWEVFFRPFSLDIMAGRAGPFSYTAVRLDLLFGGGVIF